MQGSPIWNIGTACASDADCDYYLASTCEVSSGLCQGSYKKNSQAATSDA